MENTGWLVHFTLVQAFKGIIIWVFTGNIINGSGTIQSGTRDNSEVRKILSRPHVWKI